MKNSHTYSISTLTSLYSQSLSSTLDAQLIKVEGFYFDNQGKIYGHCYYDEIKDKNKKNSITIQLTENVKSQLVSGRYYQFQGYVNKGQNLTSDSRLQVYFRVTKVLKHEADVQLISKIEYDIVRERFDRDFPIIQDVLLNKIEKGKNPILDVIIGVKSTSKEDYLNQLYNDEYYTIRHHMCNLSSQTDILRFIDSYDFKDTDLLIILRGGGTGLEIFNELELCEKIINIPAPFVTGIGHHEDITLLQRVSDRAFSTPTSVGVFLQKVVDSYKERRQLFEDKENELLMLKKQALLEKNILEDKIEKQRKTLKKVFGLIVLMIIIFSLLVSKLYY